MALSLWLAAGASLRAMLAYAHGPPRAGTLCWRRRPSNSCIETMSSRRGPPPSSPEPRFAVVAVLCEDCARRGHIRFISAASRYTRMLDEVLNVLRKCGMVVPNLSVQTSTRQIMSVGSLAVPVCRASPCLLLFAGVAHLQHSCSLRTCCCTCTQVPSRSFLAAPALHAFTREDRAAVHYDTLQDLKRSQILHGVGQEDLLMQVTHGHARLGGGGSGVRSSLSHSASTVFYAL